MIDEKKTFEMFEYYSYDLKPKSSKKVVCICNNCSKERILKKQDYHDLCGSCCKKGRKISLEWKRKLSEANKGENNPNYGKINENAPNWKGVGKEMTSIRKKIRTCHRDNPKVRKIKSFLNSLGYEIEIHHEWIGTTEKYESVQFVDAKKHRKGIIEIVWPLDGILNKILK